MKRVICDTNIWYYLGSGELKIENFQDVKLVATPLNVMELGFAHPENKKDFDFKLVQKAAKAVLDYSSEIIEEEPFEFLAKVITPSNLHKCLKYPPKRFLIKDILKNIVNETSPISKDDYENKYQSLFTEFLKYKTSFKENLNNLIEDRNKNGLRKKYYNQLTKNEKQQFDKGIGEYLEWINLTVLQTYIAHLLETKNEDVLYNFLKRSLKGFFKKNTQLYCFINDSIKKNDIFFIEELIIRLLMYKQYDFAILNKDNLFYIKTLKSFIIQLTKQRKQNVEENDCFDLLNLIYVLEDDVYFTREKQWKRYIKDAGLSNRIIDI